MHAEKDLYAAVEDSSVRIVGNNSFDTVQNNSFSNVTNLREEETGTASIRRVGLADIKIVSPLSGVLSRLMRPKKSDSSWGEFDLVERLSYAKIASLIGGGTLEPFSEVSMISGSSVSTIGKDLNVRVAGNHDMTVAGSESFDVEGRSDRTFEESLVQIAGENFEAHAGESIIFTVGDASLEMDKSGDINIIGRNIKINGKRIDLN